MERSTASFATQVVSKVPEVTLGFWVIKVAATTLGETGGDWVSMSLNLGYLIGSEIFLILFIGLVYAQVKAREFPSLPVLGDHCRHDHAWHDHGGLRR